MSGKRQQAPPNLIGTANVEFDKNEFQAAIWKKGYSVTIEKAVRCPCQTEGGSPLISCNNCHGFGWIFVNPIETIAIITAINSENKYKSWSVENMNRANISLMHQNRLRYFDRITIDDSISEISENRAVRKNGTGKYFCFLSYKVIEILAIFKYTDSVSPLQKIDSSKYTTEGSKIIFNDGVVGENEMISFTYTFKAQYNVLDIPHNVRGSRIMDNGGNLKYMNLPVSAVIQKSHTIMDRSNFDGGNIINNSWL